ncbi:carbonic anhydrase 4-like [Cochliomyia hominivorax]
MPNETILENNAHNLNIRFEYDEVIPTIKLDFSKPISVKGIFCIDYVYFQWFETAAALWSQENLTFPAEFHAIFYNVKQKNLNACLDLEKSIIILAFGIQVVPLANQSFEILQENLKYVREEYTRQYIPNNNLNYWIPIDKGQRLCIYEGSMMAYYCKAKVIWIDFESPLIISEELMHEFEKLRSYENDKPLMKEVGHFIQPKGKIFTNIKKMPPLGSSPNLNFLNENDGGNSRFDCHLSTLIMIILMIFLNLFVISV